MYIYTYIYIYIYLRHPTVDRYQPDASRVPGHAATCGEQDKQTRYPASGGRVVRTLALESWGRVGAEGEELLQLVAAEAVRNSRRRGHVLSAGSFMRTWRATPDACLQKGIAACLVAARCGLPGRALQRWHPEL